MLSQCHHALGLNNPSSPLADEGDSSASSSNTKTFVRMFHLRESMCLLLQDIKTKVHIATSF